MINEEKTFEMFGYYSSGITSHSQVIEHCVLCNTDRILSKYNAIKSKMCAKCQRTKNCKNNAVKNRIGRKHSDETKKKIGDANKGNTSHNKGKKLSKSTRDKIGEANKNRIWSEESKKKLSNSHKGKKLSDEHRKKISLKNKSRSGVNNPMYGKPAKHSVGEYYIKSDGTKIWMRSSWEIKVAKYLDDKNCIWIYEPESFPIKYTFEGVEKNGTFRPDFFIEESGEYWEIKGWWRGDSKEKFEAFFNQYEQLDVKLLMKKELDELDIL